ncbi:MAG: hypothetical protein IPK19_26390 [Chloroflexi bacterium]|nr:hypothetical protein [Chloroflexota bacterium]
MRGGVTAANCCARMSSSALAATMGEPLFEASPDLVGSIGVRPARWTRVREGMCMVTTQDATGRLTGKAVGHGLVRF